MNISGLSVFDAYFQQKYVSANTSATEKSDVFSQIEAVSPVNESEDSSQVKTTSSISALDAYYASKSSISFSDILSKLETEENADEEASSLGMETSDAEAVMNIKLSDAGEDARQSAKAMNAYEANFMYAS